VTFVAICYSALVLDWFQFLNYFLVLFSVYFFVLVFQVIFSFDLVLVLKYFFSFQLSFLPRDAMHPRY